MLIVNNVHPEFGDLVIGDADMLINRDSGSSSYSKFVPNAVVVSSMTTQRRVATVFLVISLLIFMIGFYHL